MSHDSIGLDPGGIIPHEKREETGHPGRKKKDWKWDDLCPCGCGQTLKQDFDRRYDCDRPRKALTRGEEAYMAEFLQKLVGSCLDITLTREPQNEGFGEPELKE